jgi:deazaflavin-dependent oxidoreductase (nitroreductase family)
MTKPARSSSNAPTPDGRTSPKWRSAAVWGGVILGLAWLLSQVKAFREHDPATVNRLKEIERRWANPVILAIAGHAPWPVSRLEHRGRRSGALRVTPLLAEPIREGFIMTLPYGKDADWAKNLLHAGEGILRHHGVRYRVGNPRFVAVAEAPPETPLLLRGITTALGLDEFLRVDVLPSLTAEIPPPA